MVLATVLFAGMGVCVKQASQHVGTAEVVFFRGLVGALLVGALAWQQGLTLRTHLPLQHLGRGVAGVSALSLWFYCIAQLPLATAVTLNYMSSVWMAVILIALQLWRRHRGTPSKPVRPGLVGAVLVGFAGVALVLQPTLEQRLWLEGLAGLLSGVLSAWAYLQVASLGRRGEPEHRVVFYFSLCGCAVGAAMVGLKALATAGALASTAWSWPPSPAWGWLLGTGVLATLAQLAMTRAYAQGQALAMASLQYLGIVHAFLLGVWLFGEPASAMAMAGTVLIVAAGLGATHLSRAIRD